MPSEYEALVAALKLLSIPFAEYDWHPRPEGAYGVISLDMESGVLSGDGLKQDRAWDAMVDLFFPKLMDRTDLIEAVEEVLTEICGGAWELYSIQHERETGLFHVQWIGRVMDTAGEGNA